jgi:hypothetical protein
MTRDTHIDDLSAALVPVLLHKLNNATQYLSALNSLLALGPENTPLSYFDGLGGTSRDVDELGWLLGVAANACGANLLLERRERAGLAAMVRVTAEILRREGRDLERVDRALPEISALDTRGSRDAAWRSAWLVGSWLLSCGRELPRDAVLAWDLSFTGAGFALAARVPLSPALRERVERWCALPLDFELSCHANDAGDEARLVVTLRTKTALECSA